MTLSVEATYVAANYFSNADKDADRADVYGDYRSENRTLSHFSEVTCGPNRCLADDAQFRVRQAELEDVQAIVRIYLEGFESSWGYAPNRPLEDYVTMFGVRVATPLGNSRIWIAQAGNHVVGWQALQDLGFVAQSSTYVDSKWHTRGVGKELLSHAQREASSLGFTHIVGWIRKDNRPSIGLVRSSGWQFLGSLPRCWINGPEYDYYVHTVIDAGEAERRREQSP